MASDVQRDLIIAEGNFEDRERVPFLGPGDMSMVQRMKGLEGSAKTPESGMLVLRRRGKVATMGRHCRWPSPRPSAKVRRLGFGQIGIHQANAISYACEGAQLPAV